ncbi:hypothetical protein [Chlorogloeopsis sp. ULAP02]|uniref:hypothetical protein n=1 Tax=Chlorogloeopsis sp. ULAP02 TaxID=3107926 RepID=UPI003136D4DF
MINLIWKESSRHCFARVARVVATAVAEGSLHEPSFARYENLTPLPFFESANRDIR